MNNPILDELYAIRAQIWKECGETLDGYFDYMRAKAGKSSFRCIANKPVKPRFPRKSSRRSPSRRKKAEATK